MYITTSVLALLYHVHFQQSISIEFDFLDFPITLSTNTLTMRKYLFPFIKLK